MSYPASNWALYFARCSSASARYVLMILADAHNGTDDRCFPSITTLCELSGLPKRTVYACLKQLEDDGLISRSKLSHENGRQVGVEYELHMQFSEIRPEAPESMRRKHVRNGGTIGEGAPIAPQGGGCTPCTPEGAPIAPQGVHPLHPSKENRERENREKNREARPASRAKAGKKPSYTEEFEQLWNEVPKPGEDPLANPGSKSDAFTAWKRLDDEDRNALWHGWLDYLGWLEDKRKARPDHPIKQLVSFINGRLWETYSKEAA